MPNNGNILEGADVIRKSMLGMLNSGSKVISYNAKTLYVMLCSDKIIEIGKFRISFTVPGKPEVEEDTGKYMTIWEKAADGTLKIKVETWNSDAHPVAQE
jgi:ketosteroid isomerase-like protein